MLDNLKPLIVILGLAAVGFSLVRPLCLSVMTSETFKRRTKVWFLLTLAAFLSPAYWIFAIAEILVLIWAVKREKNPLALFVLLAFVVPNSKFYIPGLVFNQIFDLTQYRLLALFVLIPAISRWASEERRPDQPWFNAFDLALSGFLILQVVLSIPNQSTTETARQSFLLVIDFLVIFYAFSRISSRAHLVDVMMCFFVSVLLMALVAIVEWSKGWLLYTGLSSIWGDPNIFAYTLRGDSLRAQASSGNTLNLGYQLAIALGFAVYLKTIVPRSGRMWLAIAVMMVGLYATSSRGPWLTAFLLVAIYVMARPGAARQIFPVMVFAGIAVAAMYFTPLKESILDRLPIIGNADQDTIEYRQQLADLSFTLIRQNPFFGDPFVATRMESLRQGQGIIDIVNGYLFTLLFTGGVGLFFQMTSWLGAFVFAAREWLKIRRVSPDVGRIGAILLSAFLATLFFHATAGSGPTTYILAGLLVGFASMCRRRMTTVSAAIPKSSNHQKPHFIG